MQVALNPFEAFADAAKTPRQRAYEAKRSGGAALPRVVMTPGERAQKERHAENLAKGKPQEMRELERRKLSRAYRRYKAERLRDLLAGPHGRNIVDLRKFMRRLTIDDAGALVDHIPTCRWIWELDADRRHQVRELIAARIVRIRQLAGFHPFDDALPESMCEPGEYEPDAKTIILDLLDF